ncbi:MAG TPA: hypothetical protein VGP07_12595 [Polyangia bacterium]|jgi:hypothetical protein
MGPQNAFKFTNAIGVARPSERLLGLRRQHDRLLSDVARKRKALERAEVELERISAEVARRLTPVIEESSRIDAELHRLFDELFAKPKLSKRARRAIREVYEQLQDEGVLSVNEREGFGDAAAAPDLDEDGDDDPPQAEVPAAAPVNASATLRGIFLRLARALHPDRVQDDGEKDARTETMKEINRAYREGDVARLAELERNLKERGLFEGAAAGEGGGDDAERTCAALEETNEALRQQLKKLRRALRALRDSDMGQMAAELERRRRLGVGGDPFVNLDADAQADLERFRLLRDYVRAFLDGEITLDDFLAGPPSDEDELDFEDLAEPPRRPRGRARKSAR